MNFFLTMTKTITSYNTDLSPIPTCTYNYMKLTHTVQVLSNVIISSGDQCTVCLQTTWTQTKHTVQKYLPADSVWKAAHGDPVCAKCLTVTESPTSYQHGASIHTGSPLAGAPLFPATHSKILHYIYWSTMQLCPSIKCIHASSLQ